jgi:hypothetical protein
VISARSRVLHMSGHVLHLSGQQSTQGRVKQCLLRVGALATRAQRAMGMLQGVVL